MQPAEGAAFVVVQAEALLELAVVVLDTPAELGEVHEPGQWRVGGQVGEPVLDRLVLVLGHSASSHRSPSTPSSSRWASWRRTRIARNSAASAPRSPSRHPTVCDVFTADGEYEN